MEKLAPVTKHQPGQRTSAASRREATSRLRCLSLPFREWLQQKGVRDAVLKLEWSEQELRDALRQILSGIGPVSDDEIREIIDRAVRYGRT